MSARTSPKRAYHSKRRQEQARQTRLAIIEAARRMFIEKGYSGAAIEAIAHAAGVAPETVYAAFGSKKEILSALVDVSLLGDDQPTPLLQRPGPQQVVRQTDPRLQIQLFSQDMRHIMARMAPIFEVINAAAKTEQDIAALRNEMLAGRLEGIRFFIDALSRNSPLRQGLDASSASETVWALTSAEVFNLLTGQCGWSGEQYEAWLADTLIRLLLD